MKLKVCIIGVTVQTTFSWILSFGTCYMISQLNVVFWYQQKLEKTFCQPFFRS